jgi:hypothetical protein
VSSSSGLIELTFSAREALSLLLVPDIDGKIVRSSSYFQTVRLQLVWSKTKADRQMEIYPCVFWPCGAGYPGSGPDD